MSENEEQSASGSPKQISCKSEGLDPLEKQCLSKELAALLNTPTTTRMTRANVIKNVWTYIKKHDLQDPKSKKYIIPDDKMAAVFGNERFIGFPMAKNLERHYKRNPVSTFDIEVLKTCNSEGLGPLDKQCLSSELVTFLNVSPTTKMTRAQVTKKVWRYIIEHDLQDPQEKKYIVPDDKMAAVFGNERFVGFPMAKKLEKHYKRDFVPTFNGTEGTASNKKDISNDVESKNIIEKDTSDMEDMEDTNDIEDTNDMEDANDIEGIPNNDMDKQHSDSMM